MKSLFISLPTVTLMREGWHGHLLGPWYKEMQEIPAPLATALNHTAQGSSGPEVAVRNHPGSHCVPRPPPPRGSHDLAVLGPKLRTQGTHTCLLKAGP